ncbi:type II secretion system GspH family protein [Patescibacteria group bacterium]|nr:type II secretion system GspH family protein [Patescibacteria group bacterium]
MSLSKLQSKSSQGFTLIELVVVIGILAVLLTIVLVAVNPSKQFQAADDTKRRSDVNAILNAISQYSADHHGLLPSGIGDSAAEIGTLTNLCSDLITSPGNYIPALPVDPTLSTGPITTCTGSFTTDYSAMHDSSGRVTVASILNSDISVMR